MSLKKQLGQPAVVKQRADSLTMKVILNNFLLKWQTLLHPISRHNPTPPLLSSDARPGGNDERLERSRRRMNGRERAERMKNKLTAADS